MYDEVPMKFYLSAFLTFTLLVEGTYAVAQEAAKLRVDGDGFVTLWEKRFAPRDYGEAEIYGLAHAPDGGVYAAGNIDVSNEEGHWGFSTDAFLKRFDADGRIIWEKTLGGPDEYDGFNALAAMPDGGVVAAGINESRSKAGEGYGWAVRFDADGAVIWDKTFHRPQNALLYRFATKGGIIATLTKGWDVFYTAAPAPDGGVYLAGETSQDDEDGDGWVLHLDADGNIVKEQSFGGARWDDVMSIMPAPQSGLYVSGTYGAGYDKQYGHIIRYDANGHMMWSQDIKGADGELMFYAMGLLENGNIIVIGDDENGYPSRGKFVQMDAHGAILTQALIGGLEDKHYFSAIGVTPKDDIYVAGHFESYDEDYGHGMIYKLNASGGDQAKAYFRGASDTFFDAILLAENGDIIVAGSTDTQDGAQTDAVIMRLSPPD